LEVHARISHNIINTLLYQNENYLVFFTSTPKFTPLENILESYLFNEI